MKLQSRLKETITVLCKNSLQFKKGLCIDALIGITTDDASTFLVKLEETVNHVTHVTEHNYARGEITSDCVEFGLDRSTLLRKRPPGGDTCSTPVKRRRSSDDGCDEPSTHNNNSDANVYNYDNDTGIDSKWDNTVLTNHVQSDGNLVFVKQEQSDDEEQFFLADQSQIDDMAPDDATPDDTAPDDTEHDGTAPEDRTPDGTAPDDTAPDDRTPDSMAPDDTAHDGSSADGGSHDDDSSILNQSSTIKTEPNVTESQQVCDLLVYLSVSLKPVFFSCASDRSSVAYG